MMMMSILVRARGTTIHALHTTQTAAASLPVKQQVQLCFSTCNNSLFVTQLAFSLYINFEWSLAADLVLNSLLLPGFAHRWPETTFKLSYSHFC